MVYCGTGNCLIDLDLIFDWRGGSLQEQPPTFRNTPIVSSAIYWSKNLYHRIVRPMKELKEVKLVHQLKVY